MKSYDKKIERGHFLFDEFLNSFEDWIKLYINETDLFSKFIWSISLTGMANIRLSCCFLFELDIFFRSYWCVKHFKKWEESKIYDIYISFFNFNLHAYKDKYGQMEVFLAFYFNDGDDFLEALDQYNFKIHESDFSKFKSKIDDYVDRIDYDRYKHLKKVVKRLEKSDELESYD